MMFFTTNTAAASIQDSRIKPSRRPADTRPGSQARAHTGRAEAQPVYAWRTAVLSLAVR
jgi:hypothetical protein